MAENPAKRDVQGMRLRLDEILKRRGVTQTRVAAEIGISDGFMSQLVRNRRVPSMKVLQDLARYLDVDPGALIEPNRTIAVAGRVGAGESVELFDAFEKGAGFYHIACPEDLQATGIVAVEVCGNSMQPLMSEGDILLFSRAFIGVDTSAHGRVCICETEDGRALVKLLRPGREPGFYDLHSVNNTFAPEYGIKLRWASPYRRHILKADVIILDPSELEGA